MPVPTDAKVFEEFIDPTDILDFQINLAPLLQAGETIASHSVTLPTESVLLGLELKTTGGYATTLNGNILTIWLGIIPEEINNPSFVAGVTLPIEVTVTTSATPPRRKQRTVAVEVKQR